jgi:formamidopyrimidine-DNA glycosylase
VFELPEYLTLAAQMNATLKGKIIQRGRLGNSPHKFVWYNHSHEEFERLTEGKQVGEGRVKGRWLSLPLEPGYTLVLGECGGRMLYHPPGARVPAKYHLYLIFEDGSFFTATTQMWGAIELYQRGEEQKRQYIKGMKTTPIEPEFTFDYFNDILDKLIKVEKRSAKSLLTQDRIISGLGNAIAQDILFQARLNPKHPITDLNADQRHSFYQAIIDTLDEVTRQGGRYDEYDLFNNPGGYIRLMDKHALARPCPRCGGEIKKMQYLGGACYFCPNCQT